MLQTKGRRKGEICCMLCGCFLLILSHCEGKNLSLINCLTSKCASQLCLQFSSPVYSALHTRNISTLSNNFLGFIWQLVLAHPQVRTRQLQDGAQMFLGIAYSKGCYFQVVWIRSHCIWSLCPTQAFSTVPACLEPSNTFKCIRTISEKIQSSGFS